MLKNHPCFLLFIVFIASVPIHSIAQCRSAPVAPLCLGTEPLLVDNEVLNQGITKWYYGGAVTMNSLTLNGGTLVVAGDLTIDRFYMDSGTIYISPGARFVIGSGIGAGLILKGNSAIYNYGRCEVQRNLSLESGYASAVKPNLVINANTASIFRMPNQYFVINNAFSWFVNNGSAEFWGIITDPLSSPAAVCLGNGSSTRMAVLINKIMNTYAVPAGTACLNVYQYSQFYNQLTADNGLLVCLGSGHTSDAGCIPSGCTPNHWGAAQVFSNCTGCSSVIALGMEFTSFMAVAKADDKIQLEWKVSSGRLGYQFRIERSRNGQDFSPIDSILATDTRVAFQYIDNNPLKGNNYYMIRLINQLTGNEVSSKIIRVTATSHTPFTIYPMPFDDKISISYAPGMLPEKIILTDVMGRNILIRNHSKESSRNVEVDVLENLEPGIYIIHLRTSRNVVSRTIIKR